MQEYIYIIPVSFQKGIICVQKYTNYFIIIQDWTNSKRTNNSKLSIWVSLQYLIFKIKDFVREQHKCAELIYATTKAVSASELFLSNRASPSRSST